jgi:hypothetical protein
MLSDWVLFLAYSNLFEIKDFVVVVVVVVVVFSSRRFRIDIYTFNKFYFQNSYFS